MQEVEFGYLPAGHVIHWLLTSPKFVLQVWQADKLVQVAQLVGQPSIGVSRLNVNKRLLAHAVGVGNVPAEHVTHDAPDSPYPEMHVAQPIKLQVSQLDAGQAIKSSY